MSRMPSTFLHPIRSEDDELLPDVTVLLYGRNKSRLQRTLADLAVQRDLTFETILLHEGALRQPGEWLETQRPLAWPSALPLFVLAIDTPVGKGKAVNAALPHVRAPFLLILEEGDRFDPDALVTMRSQLRQEEDSIIGVYGNLVIFAGDETEPDQILEGESTPSRRRLLSRLSLQRDIAPPLLRRTAVEKVDGVPTDYPSQGWKLADTALILSLLRVGKFRFLPDLHVDRTQASRSKAELHDEHALYQVLLRQAAKRLNATALLR